jgi:hypothetical protein
VTTGTPLYLVSACGSAEEFIAAFRRYADRTGLFVPSASPLPAGRRGRIAITLSDGGVMIEGEAEILQSSARPTVLHGRPGMTVKFVEPDEPSKTVIGELEKARLAIKPAPPSVHPRPAEIPPTPRPVVPTPSGRIDAANALAECVVIGDPSTLKETATSPRTGADLRFVVPSIPAVGAPRPKSPSVIPPIPPKPATTAERPKTPTVPPDPAATPLPNPAVSTRMTSIGFPALKLPAKPDAAKIGSGAVAAPTTSAGSGAVSAVPTAPGSGPIAAKPTTDSGPIAAKPTTDSGPIAAKPTTDSGPVSNSTTLGLQAIDRKPEPPNGPRTPRTDATPPRFSVASAQPAPAPAATSPHDEPTAIGAGVSKAASKPPVASSSIEPIVDDEATSFGEMPVAPPASTVQADANPRRNDSSKHKATSIGFPVIRSTFATQPLGLVPPAAANKLDLPTEPSPPTLPKSARQPQAPRGKNPTTPPLTPRHPTPVAPVPIVRSPAKAAPVVADEERTDLSELPTNVSAPLEVDPSTGSGATEKPAPAQRSGGMRASEILAAIPAGDWTMAPDESVPHVLTPDEKVPVAPPSEPTPAPAPPPKGPPTGDWTISLDPQSGWTEPAKPDKPAVPPPTPDGRPASPASGNPIHAVSSEKPIDVQQWDEKPTSIGESKIEIDSTLMEPLAAMPMDEAPGDADAAAHSAPRLPPTPPAGAFAATASASSAYNLATAPTYQMPAAGYGVVSTAGVKRNKMIALAVGAATVAIGAIVILVLTLGGHKQSAQATTGSGAEMVAPEAADAAAPGSAAIVEPPADSETAAGSQTDEGDEGDEADEGDGEDGSAAAPEPAVATDHAGETPTGTCKVTIKSIPAGADVLLGKQKLGTAPGTFELPCGSESKLTLRKRSFTKEVRSFTPSPAKSNQLVVRLGRHMISVKVTSTPAGATITAGGRSVGVTPTTIRLPASGSSTIRLTKPGYAAETKRLSVRQKKGTVHVTLKRGRGR